MKQEFENSPENYLQNIADDLSSISGTCNEIKETQLNCATTDDLNNLSTSVTSAVTEKVDEMKTSIEKQTKAVGGIGSDLTTTVNDSKTEITEKIDNFTANPPVQKVEKTIRIAKETWQIYLSMFISVFTPRCSSEPRQSGRKPALKRPRISDIKYHYILMHGGVGSEGLDSIESWFRDPERVKQIEKEVKAYEDLCRKPPALSTRSSASKKKSTNSIQKPQTKNSRK